MSCDRSLPHAARAALLALGASLALGGCSAVDPGFGEAVKYDMALQVIDPAPVYAPTDAKPGDHGERAQRAIDRYRKGAVKQPPAASITGGGTGATSTPGS